MKKTLINSITGFISQFIILILGLVVPRIILEYYGSDTNGLTSTITQIFTYLALLEAGIATAARNVLYTPIKNGDKNMISYWISAARRNYRNVSWIYLVVVILASFIFPFFLKTAVSYWTIVFYILFEGLTSVISFYFLNIWNVYLVAEGKNYVNNIIILITKVLCYAIKIVLAIFSVNIAFIQVGYFIVSLLQLLIYYIYMKKKYGWIDYNAAPPKTKLPDTRAYFITEIAWAIFSSTDMIVLSLFVSTSLASVYSVYNMIFLALSNLLNSVYVSINYHLGQTFVKDIEKYKKLHSAFNSFFMSMITILMCVSYWLTIPFVKLYTKDITDINYIYEWLPLFFCLIQLLSWSRFVPGNLSGIAGYAKQTGLFSLFEAIFNLTLSIILVNFWGIYGVLIATIISLPFKVIYLNWLAERKILKRSPLKTILTLCVNFSLFAITCIIEKYVNISIDDYLSFFFFGIILTFGYTLITFLLNFCVNKDMFIFLARKK